MALVIVGGHSRSVGKTSVVAGLIERLPKFNWTAFKITQYGHGICSANGESCDCATDDHTVAITRERDRSGESDSSRFLVAGARESFWVRTRQGYLAEIMPRLRKELAVCENAIVESNSLMRFVVPDLYLVVLDPANADFKESARYFLDRADAVLLHERTAEESQGWKDVPIKVIERKPLFRITAPTYLSDEVVAFVSGWLANAALHGSRI
jgi:hypothetical protein